MKLILVFCVIACCGGCGDRPVDGPPALKGDFLGQPPPGPEPEIFAEGVLSFGFHEHDITISPQGDEIFFVTSSGDHNFYAIVRAFKENGKWAPLEIAPFSGEYMDMTPAFSTDGESLLFSSRRPRTADAEARQDFDIWRVNKNGSVWEEPVNLGPTVNSKWNEMYPTQVDDGSIYFQYFEESGSASDFYVSRSVEGGLADPVKLPPGLNSDGYESALWVAPNETIALFQSIRDGGFGGVDLYVCHQDERGGWSEPKNLGRRISSDGNVISPRLSPDGRFLFFSRNGPMKPFQFTGHTYQDLRSAFSSPGNGYGSLYWVDASSIPALADASGGT